MKVGRFIWSVLLLLGIASKALAQFSGPAFDKDVYVPQKGTDIDFIYSKYWDSSGWDLHNLGPVPGDVTDRVSFLGYAGNPYYQTIFDAAPPFNLSSLKVIQKSNVHLPRGTIFGHFHSSKVKDALVTYDVRWPTIYWADENGLFDSSRRTYLLSSLGPKKSYVMNPYVASLTSDSLDDIVLDAPWGPSVFYDSVFLLLYKGGTRLMEMDTVYQDTSIYFGPPNLPNLISNMRLGTIADFRGTGRKDFLASDAFGNWFLYKNTNPFSLEKFVSSLHSDTLLAAWENPHLDELGYVYAANRFTMRALPRPSWDQSVDFMPSLRTDDWRQKCIAIFRGGPHFGEHRLTLDSAEMYLRSPGLIDFNWSGLLGLEARLDCGDMTGTGQPVLMAVTGFDGYHTYKFFYVLGRAIDDKVDMVIEYPFTSLANDQISLNADLDNYQDILMGSFVRLNDQVPYPGKAELWLLHGTNRIPAKLNPNYAVEERKALSARSNKLLASPNPFEQKTVLTFDNCSDGVMYMEIVNTLGKIMLREEIVEVDGLQQYSADLSMLVPGAYHIRLVCPADGWSATATVIKH